MRCRRATPGSPSVSRVARLGQEGDVVLDAIDDEDRVAHHIGLDARLRPRAAEVVPAAVSGRRLRLVLDRVGAFRTVGFPKVA